MEPTKTETLTLNFTTVSAVHPLDNETLEVTMKDLEAEKEMGFWMNVGFTNVRELHLLQVAGWQQPRHNMEMIRLLK